MTSQIKYTRRKSDGLLKTTKIAELLPDWRGKDERWLFFCPHDDDMAVGGSLVFQVGIAEGAQLNVTVVTDGRMGYCRPEHRNKLAEIRRQETQRSFEILGLPSGNLEFLGYPDGHLSAFRGCFFAGDGPLASQIVGLEASITRTLRRVRPNRVFLATSTDLHPDHRITHEEVLISLFHAQGSIWPELGAPMPEIPQVYEFACYCDFPEPPQIRIETPLAMLERKFEGIRAYASQEQIGTVVEIQRAVGPVEYLRELHFRLYSPQQYHALFTEPA